MRLILNVIWLVFGGLWLAIAYAFAGVVMCIAIFTIPFGLQAFKLASFALWPFGRTLAEKPRPGTLSPFRHPSFVVLGNVFWLLLAGWWIALSHLVTAIAQAITIIGIPLAIANAKLVPAALWPMGREVAPASAANDPFGL